MNDQIIEQVNTFNYCHLLIYNFSQDLDNNIKYTTLYRNRCYFMAVKANAETDRKEKNRKFRYEIHEKAVRFDPKRQSKK